MARFLDPITMELLYQSYEHAHGERHPLSRELIGRWLRTTAGCKHTQPARSMVGDSTARHPVVGTGCSATSPASPTAPAGSSPASIRAGRAVTSSCRRPPATRSSTRRTSRDGRSDCCGRCSKSARCRYGPHHGSMGRMRISRGSPRSGSPASFARCSPTSPARPGARSTTRSCVSLALSAATFQ